MRTLRAIVGESKRLAITVLDINRAPIDLTGMSLSGSLGKGGTTLEEYADDDFDRSEQTEGRVYVVSNFTQAGTWYLTLTIMQGPVLLDKSKHRIVVRPEQ